MREFVKNQTIDIVIISIILANYEGTHSGPKKQFSDFKLSCESNSRSFSLIGLSFVFQCLFLCLNSVIG